MNLYQKMDKELRSLFEYLFRPEAKNYIEIKMNEILKTARLIGGVIEQEAEMLQKDIVEYLKHPKDPRIIAILKQHAMRLKQETGEI